MKYSTRLEQINIWVVLIQLLCVALICNLLFNVIQSIVGFELSFFMWATVYLLCLFILLRSLRLNGIALSSYIGEFSLSNVPWITLIMIKLLLILFSWLSQSIGLTFASIVERDLYKDVLSSLVVQSDVSSTNNINVIMMMIISFTLAPIFEEFFFRGFLLNRWRVKMGLRNAVIVSSLLFAFLHFDILVFLAYFSSGIFYSLVYIKTQKLIVPILLHSLTNLISSMTYFLPGLAITSVDTLEQAAMISTTIYFLLIPAIAFMLFQLYKTTIQSNDSRQA